VVEKEVGDTLYGAEGKLFHCQTSFRAGVLYSVFEYKYMKVLTNVPIC
jgi:hypothetical protein